MREQEYAELMDTPEGRAILGENSFTPYERAYSAVDGYSCKHGRVFAEKVIQGGETIDVPLSDFAPIIKEEITRDDGAEAKKEMCVEGVSRAGRVLPSTTVPAGRLASMSWVLDAWGVEANIHPGQNKRDQLRYAMQQASLPGMSQRTIYSHTGWRKIGGEWCYLYHGGAIGRDGLSVELEGNLTAYNMPEANAQGAVQASMDFLKMGNLRVTAPLLCSMYLAPLFHFMKKAGCAPAFIPFVAGATGTRKTTITTLALSHFGNFNPKQPPASFADTVNSIRRKAFILKDMPLLVDDFHPNTDSRARANMIGAAQQLARAWGDLAERGRMQADLTVKNSEPPRGMGIMSGEDVPDTGESGIARFYVIDVHEGDVYVNDTFTALQEKARDGVLAQAMRGYIDGLRDKVEDLSFRPLFDSFRKYVTHKMPAAHGRVQEAVACLMVGMDSMLNHWQSMGMDVGNLRAEITEALMENALEQQSYMSKEKPADMFLGALRELLATGESFVSGMGGTMVGTLIGWCVGKKVYLLPRAAYRAVSGFCGAQGSSFPIGSGQLWKRMYEQGLLETNGTDMTVVRKLDGKNQRVLSLDKAAITGEEVQEAIM